MHAKWVFITVSGLASVAMVGAGLAFRAQLGPLSLDDELAAARREGLIVDPAQMPKTTVPPAQDGTAEYRQAAALANRAVQNNKWNLEFHPLAGPIDHPLPAASHSPEIRAQLGKVIAKHDKAITLLRKAGLKGRLADSTNGIGGISDDSDAIVGTRVLTKTLVVRADLRRVEGDFAGAREDVMTLARSAALYRDADLLTEGLTRIEIEREALRAAQEYAAARPFDPESPKLLRDVVRALGSPLEIRRLLQGEVLMSLRYIPFAARHDSMLSFAPVSRANQAYQLSYWRAVFKALPKDPQDFDGARKAMISVSNAYERDKSLRAQLLTTRFRDVDYIAQSEARRRVAFAAADVLERWQRDKRVPSTLIAPPEDPFGGGPLHYLPSANGFVVYSYDRDGVDHRGMVSSGRRKLGDIAVRISL